MAEIHYYNYLREMKITLVFDTIIVSNIRSKVIFYFIICIMVINKYHTMLLLTGHIIKLLVYSLLRPQLLFSVKSDC